MKGSWPPWEETMCIALLSPIFAVVVLILFCLVVSLYYYELLAFVL